MKTEVSDNCIEFETPPKCILTSREVEYLGLVAFGFHNSQKAQILYVNFFVKC